MWTSHLCPLRRSETPRHIDLMVLARVVHLTGVFSPKSTMLFTATPYEGNDGRRDGCSGFSWLACKVHEGSPSVGVGLDQRPVSINIDRDQASLKLCNTSAKRRLIVVSLPLDAVRNPVIWFPCEELSVDCCATGSVFLIEVSWTTLVSEQTAVRE